MQILHRDATNAHPVAGEHPPFAASKSPRFQLQRALTSEYNRPIVEMLASAGDVAAMVSTYRRKIPYFDSRL
ncbi:hypothetical protein PQQ64_19750 [Paraburkholderia graminis]|uniref:hypothetical protein n=1 Tax=Paraburkholderia graminis TaxID=60548 RepID=UPI0038B910E9